MTTSGRFWVIAKGTEKETPDKEGHGLFARSAKIGGNCHLTTYTSGRDKEPPLRFECYGRVLLQEASIGNSLVMAGAKIDWTRAVPYPALDISGTTIGGHAKFMVWQSEESSECIRFEVDANDTALRLAGTRIAQKLILNGAMIRRSRIAINASNIEIGGKASLSSYGERGATKDREPVIFHFTASGRVILTAATIKLGLDMSGALLTPDVSASRGDDARSANNSVALDLTLARMKFLQLRGLAYSDTLATTTQRRKPFEALGSVVFRHAEIDTDIDLRGGLFRGRIVADYARVGGAVDLTGSRFSGGSARIIREQILRNSNKIGLDDSLLESAVRAELARHHAGKLMDADLSLHSARVGGALIVDNLTVQTEIDSVKGLERLNYVIADLRGLHIEELQDCGGNGWGNAIRFWLDGFRYTRLTPLPHSPTITSSRGRASRLLRQLIGPSWCAINAHRSDQLWKRRIKWLDLQYFDRDEPQMSEFTPGAYEQLVRTLNVDGSYEDARRIASAKLTQETIVSAKLSRKIIWGPFRLLFDYGLSPTRAVCTFILCIAIGAAAAEVADTGVSWFGGIGKVLVVNTNPPETLIVDEGSTASIHSIRGDKKSLYMDEVPCGDRIRPVLYALDVFVPVLDLRQQTACSIRHDRLLWRYAQAGYAVLGWFLTPLTLLTFSGILKRHLEK